MNDSWSGIKDVKSSTSSDQLDRMLEHNPAIVYTCKLGRLWSFSYISPNVARILGYQARELLADPNLWRRCIHPDDQAAIPQRGATGLLVDDTRVFEYRFRHRDGQYRWLRDEVRLLPERDPLREPFECTGYCVDVTARRRAEEALEQSEARFQAFMYNSPAVAFMKDEDGRLVFVNPAFLRTAGLEGSDWQGKTDMDLWPPTLARQNRANDLEILSTGVPKAVEEVFPTSKGNRVIFMLKFPFRDNTGRIFLAGMGIDNTERRMLEERMVRTGVAPWIPRLSYDERIASGEITPPIAALPQGNETILLVEDEQLVRDLAVRVLSGQGYRVVEAANGSEALSMLEDDGLYCDLLLTDVVMPGLSGQAVADRMREVRPDVGVVFMSGYHDRSIFDPEKMTGRDRFMNKPFSPQELLRTVRQALDNRSA